MKQPLHYIKNLQAPSVDRWLAQSLERAEQWLKAPVQLEMRLSRRALLIGGAGLIGLLVAFVLILLPKYVLTAQAQQLIGPADNTLLHQFSLNAKNHAYYLNKKGIQSGGNSTSGVTVGQNAQAAATYSLQIPQRLSQGITTYDDQSGLSFTMVPKFATAQGKVIASHVVYPLANHAIEAVYTVKENGLQENIMLSRAVGQNLKLAYTLKLPATLVAKPLDGGIGIYSADPALFGNITYGTPADQARVAAARTKSAKDHLAFVLLPPSITTAGSGATTAHATLNLTGNTVTLAVTGLAKAQYPLSIDPSVIVTSVSDFSTGNNEGDLLVSGTNNSISEAGLTGGSLSAGWTTNGTSFANGRWAFSAVAYNGYLYILGGYNGSINYDDIQYAPLNSNGTVGSWTTNSTSFTTARRSFAATAYNGYLYIMGGYGSSLLSDVQYAPINANGSVGTWAATTSLTTANVGLSALAYNNYLYIMGGENSGGLLNAVQYAPINADGTVGTWTATTSFTTARYQFSALAYNNYLYIMGGCSAGNCTGFLNDVQYAPINSNGSVGSWTATTSFTTARDQFSAVVYNGYLYIMGGYDGTSYHNDVQYAPINSNGSIGNWNATASFTNARDAQTAVAYNGYVYLLGGYATGSGSSNYSYTGSSTTFTVPSGVTSITVDMAGASGGGTSAAPGLGGRVQGTLTVTPGEVLTVEVGGQPSGTSPEYGYGTPGSAGSLSTDTYAGGSASAILLSGTPLAVAGGGGGAGLQVSMAGGAGGGTSGGSGTSYNGGTPPTGGTQSAPGSGGTGGLATGSAGSGANGGNGGNAHDVYAGGGGGSGYYGGGGGSGDNNVGSDPSSGAGGSSLVPAGGSTTSGYRSGNGYVDISYSYSTYYSDVQYAPIDPAGVVSGWTATTSVPTATEAASSVAYNGYLYEIGGYPSTAWTAVVDYAPISSNGTVGTWTATTSLPTGTDYATSVAYNGYLYEIGGSTGSATAVVDYAPINTNGTIGSWTATTSLPTATYQATSVAYNGYLYEIGGSTGSATAVVDYAPISSNGTVGTWTATTSLLTATDQATSVVYGGYLYEIAGATNANPNGVSTVDYAPINTNGTIGSWTATTSLLGPACDATSVAYNGYLYEIGGQNNSGPLATSDYAPINSDGTIGSWTATTSIPTATDQATSVAYNGYVYEIAGSTSGGRTATVDYAQINNGGPGTTSGWTTNGTSFTTARSGLASVAYNGYLYIMGGYNGSTTFNDIQYAPIGSNGSVGSWTTNSTSFTTTRYGLGAVAYNGYLYIMGGENGGAGSYLNDVQYAPINSNGSVGTWTATTSFTTGRNQFGSVAYNGYLYIMGGYDGSSLSDVQYAAINSNGTLSSWTATTSFASGAAGPGAVAYDGYLYIMGGYNSGTYYNSVQYAPINSNGTIGSWTATTSFATARNSLSAITYNGYLYIMGGSYSGGYLNDVQIAPINNNGTIGNWAATTGFTTARQFFGVAAYDGYLYIMGGYDGSLLNDVQYAALQSIPRIGQYSRLLDFVGTMGVASVQPTTFTYTGATQTFTVPAGVTSITVDMAGAEGGSVTGDGDLPGLGGRVQGTLTVTPGQVLNVYVGGAGAATSSTTGSLGGYGYGTGGNGGNGAATSQAGAGGGGSSAIYNTTTSTLLTEAAGGGGVASNAAGGNGGGTTGSSGTVLSSGTAATGGTQSAVGSGGSGGVHAGTAGSGANGGTGGAYDDERGGGGGGGGYYGGGGGSGDAATAYEDGSGAGGSSLVPAGGTTTSGYESGNGYVTLSYSTEDANDVTPIELLTNGTNVGNPGLGGTSGVGTGGISVNYSFASNVCATFNTPSTLSTGTSDQLGTPFKLNFTTNGCGTATNIGRYVWVHYTLDDSQTASFPDINGNHTTITDFTVYYHPSSIGRLRGGATFSNGSLQSLDAAP